MPATVLEPQDNLLGKKGKRPARVDDDLESEAE